MKKLLVLLCAVLLIVGCGGNGNKTKGVKIGMNFELSGAVADYGAMELDGANLAIKLANADGGVLGEQIVAVVADTKSDVEEAVSTATKLTTQDKVSIIVGPATSGNSKASFEVANANGVANISPSATADGVTMKDGSVMAFAFTICFQDSYQGAAMAVFAVEKLGAKKAIIFGDNSSDYAKGLAEAFDARFKAEGGTIVTTEAYQAGDTNFDAVLNKIKGMDFDVLYVPGYYEEAGLIIKQARAKGINQPITGADGFDSPTLADLAGNEALNDVYFTTAYTTVTDNPIVLKFVADFKAEYGKEPSMFNALGYDACALAIDAIRRAGTTDPKAVQKALVETKDFPGVTGMITFKDDHTPSKSVLVVKLINGVQSSSVEVKP